jgi:hypothetical protein
MAFSFSTLSRCPSDICGGRHHCRTVIFVPFSCARKQVKALEFHLVHLVAFLHKATQSVFIICTVHADTRESRKMLGSLTLKNRGGTTTEPIYLGLPLSHKSATRSGFFESLVEFVPCSTPGYRKSVHLFYLRFCVKK